MTRKNILVTGVMVQYYVTCKRELWFFANQINMNYNNDDISIGKQIHEKSYSRENKEIQFDNMVLDYVQNKEDISIFEIKKSSKLTIGSKYQLYFYMFNLKKSLKKEVKGFLVYPKEKKKEEIKLTSEIEEEMDKIIENIPKIVNLNAPPSAENKPYCKKCSFYELCMI
jgi:CRISPR-associated exonuclease Cas4